MIRPKRSGIYNDVACSRVTTTNHAVVAVGWGKGNGIDFWIIRNSWGTGWGISGYIKMQRGVNLCNIEKYPAAITAVV
jgi:cathepsin L